MTAPKVAAPDAIDGTKVADGSLTKADVAGVGIKGTLVADGDVVGQHVRAARRARRRDRSPATR